MIRNQDYFSMVKPGRAAVLDEQYIPFLGLDLEKLDSEPVPVQEPPFGELLSVDKQVIGNFR